MSTDNIEPLDQTTDESLPSGVSTQNDNDWDAIFTAKLENYVSEFENNGRMPPSDMHTTVLRYIQHKNVDAIVEGEYLVAERYEKILSKFVLESSKQNARAAQEGEEYILNLEINQLRSKIGEIHQLYKDKINREKENDAKAIAQLQQKHLFEMKDFERYWNDQENIRPYTKSSSHLNNMRAQHKTLVLAKEYDKAQQFQEEIAKQEQIESAQAQKVLDAVIEKKRQKLLKKQQDELVRERQYAIKNIQILNAQHNREISNIKTRIQKLKLDKQNSRAKNRTKEFRMSADGSYSPRTKSLMNNYTRSGRPTRLSLKPLRPAIVVPFARQTKSRVK